MSEFMKTLLSLSVSGTLLFLLILGLRPFYKNRFSKNWQYYILAIAALRFVFPFTPDTTIAGSLFTGAEAAMERETRLPPAPCHPLLKGPLSGILPPAVNGTFPDSPNVRDMWQTPQAPRALKVQKASAAPAGNGFPAAPSYGHILFYLWAAAALMLLARKITVYREFTRYTKSGSTEVSDPALLNLLSECEEKLHVRGRVELYRNHLTGSPVMTGFFRPKIILPDRKITSGQLTYVFTHELLHYKRKDMFYKWFVQIALCVHWFNPFIYLLAKEINRTCELSCDELITAPLDAGERAAYGDALLFFLKADNGYGQSPASVMLTEGTRQLKERLGAIMEIKKKSKLLTACMALTTAAVCACFTLIGAYAASPRTQDNDSDREAEVYETPFPEQAKDELRIQYPSDEGEGYGTIYYTQAGFYMDSYIIEIGWNLSEKASKYYPDQRTLVLEDQSFVTVYFDETVKEYAYDEKAASAIAGLVYHLKNTNRNPALEIPLITDIVYIEGKDINLLAKEYYQEEMICRFSAIFPLLDPAVQETYCQSIYRDDNTAFFSVAVKYMDADAITSYAAKAHEDGNVAFFSILLDYLGEDAVRQYAEKCYREENIAEFSILTNYMTSGELQKWLSKSHADKRNSFHHVIYDALYS